MDEIVMPLFFIAVSLTGTIWLAAVEEPAGAVLCLIALIISIYGLAKRWDR
jgi:hypothetical protein